MTDKEIDAAIDAYDALNPFGFSDENTLPDELPTEEEEDALQQEQDADEEEPEQESDEEEELLEDDNLEQEEEEQKPKGAQARISQLAKQKNELAEQNKKLQEELAAIRAEIQPLKNLASGLDALGVNKQQQQPEASLDDQLKQYGINADDFDSDGEKRLALQTAQLQQYTQQQRMEASYNQVEQYIVNTINANPDESARNANLGAVNYLIQDKAAELAEDYGLNQVDAFNEAKREVLRQAAIKARQTGKDVSEILIAKGNSLYSRRGVTQDKPLQNKQKTANINQQAREQVAKRAGKPNVDTVNITEILDNTDPYMSKFFGG